MWKYARDEVYDRDEKRFGKNHPDELAAALDNLDTYFQTLLAGVKPAQVRHGFMHGEPMGVVAIDQGGGKKMLQTRLYVYADGDTELLHLITVGDKKSQKADVEYCKRFVTKLREAKAAPPAGGKKPGRSRVWREQLVKGKAMKQREFKDTLGMASVASGHDVAKRLKDRLARRALVKRLATLRNVAGLTQAELAEKMGCGQAKISKLESGEDAGLGVGDFAAYLKAVDCEARIFIVPRGLKVTDEVKMYAFTIHKLINQMVEMAGGDHAIAGGVAEFCRQAIRNIPRLIASAAAALPSTHAAPPSESPLRVEEDCFAPDDEAARPAELATAD